jgi:integrase/recombinase XerD
MKIAHKFYLREPKDTQNESAIYLQITYNRTNTKRAIGFDIKSKDWDANLQNAKKNHAIQNRINELNKAITDLQINIARGAQVYSVSQIANIIFNKTSVKTNLADYFEKYIEKAAQSNKIAPPTKKHYKSCLKALIDFMQTEYSVKDIPIEQADYSFIERFDAFLHKKSLGLNTINGNYHKKLKSALINAEKLEIIKGNPYANIKFKVKPTHRESLSIEELNMLMKTNLGGNVSLEKVRDIFIFSCYTGLRFADGQDLRIEQIRNEGDSNFIYRGQNKTGESVNIPLSKEALAIIDKYDTIERRINRRVMPQISNQKNNSYLKIIAELAGIKKNLTHHIARHTFATLLLNKGVSMEVVSKVLGHNNIRTTQIYAKMQASTVHNEVLVGFSKINNAIEAAENTR